MSEMSELETDTSRRAANDAILDAVRRAFPVGVHIDDLMKLLGFDARKQVQPRLYDLQNQGFIERLPAQKWRFLEVSDTNKSDENATHPQANQGQGPRKPPAKIKVALPGQINFISYKNTLQEFAQKSHLNVPQYKSEKIPIGYVCSVSFGPNSYKAEKPMPTSKDAEQRAAFDALKAEQIIPQETTFDIHVGKNQNAKRKASTPADGPPSKLLVTDSVGTVFKSKLNEFGQKFHLPPPTYETNNVSGGFVATVSFQGREFKSSQPMSKKKLAEQNAAHVALYYFGQASVLPSGADPQDAGGQPVPDGGGVGGLDVNSLITEARKESADKVSLNPAYSYKNRLQEHCQRGKMQNPIYDTHSDSGAFVSKVTLGGNEYTGPPQPNKKRAEQAIAHLVLMDLGIMQRPTADVQNLVVGMVPKFPAAMLGNKSPDVVIPKSPAAMISKPPVSMLPKPPVSMLPKPPVSMLPKPPVSMLPKPPSVMIPKPPAALLNKSVSIIPQP